MVLRSESQSGLGFKRSVDLSGDVGHFGRVRVSDLVFEIHIALIAERDEMNVGVRHFKTENSYADFPTWDDALESGSHFFGEHHHVAESGVRKVEDVVSLLLGHYERMAPADGIDIEEGIEVVVLSNFVRGNLPCNDT